MQINLPEENIVKRIRRELLDVEVEVKKLELEEDSVLIINIDFNQLPRQHAQRTVDELKNTIERLKQMKSFEAALLLPSGIDVNSYRPEQLKQVIEQIDKFKETCYRALLKKA